MDKNKFNPVAIRDAFRFLVDKFGYSITRDEEMFHEDRPYAFVIEYAGNERKIHLSHDYRENFFYFVVMRGLDTQYPIFGDQENTIIFWNIFKLFEPSLEFKTLQPHGQSCAEAAKVNAKYLQKYASAILRGEKWI